MSNPSNSLAARPNHQAGLPADKHQAGQILLILMIVVSLGIVIALSVIQVSLTGREAERYEDFSLKAYYAAEAGIESAIPRVQEAANLNGSNLDAYLVNPVNQVSIVVPASLDDSDEYTYSREARRSPSATEITRMIESNKLAQFDLSDVGDVSLEDALVSLAWTDDTCDDNGVCASAVEVTVVSQIAATTNIVYNPSFEAPVVVGTVPQAATHWVKTNALGTINLVNDASTSRFGAQFQQLVVASGDYSGWSGSGPNELDNLAGITRESANMIPLNAAVPGNPIGASEPFSLSVYVRVASSAGSVAIRPVLYEADGTTEVVYAQIDQRRQLRSTNGEWIRIFTVFEPGAAAAWLKPYVVFSANGTGTLDMDGLQLERGDYPTSFCDGTQTYGPYGSCVWDTPGSAPLSTSSRGSVYFMDRYFYDPRPLAEQVPSGYDPLTDWDAGARTIAQTITLDYPSSNRVMRVRALFGRIQATLAASPVAAPAQQLRLPGQEILITSTGYYANTKKAVTLARGLPSLLPQFDYVLYNHGCAEGTGCVPRDLIK